MTPAQFREIVELLTASGCPEPEEVAVKARMIMEPGATSDRSAPDPITGLTIPINPDGSTNWPVFAAELRRMEEWSDARPT